MLHLTPSSITELLNLKEVDRVVKIRVVFNLDHRKNLVLEDVILSSKVKFSFFLHKTSRDLKISFRSIQSILTDSLGFINVSPRMLTDENKKRRMEMSRRNLEILESDPDQFCRHVITMDETWVQHFDPETKKQSMSWKQLFSPPMKKF